MKYLFFLSTLIVLLSACTKEEKLIKKETKGNYLVFGHFYGMCAGEECIETFKLTSDKLYEDTIDEYNGESFDFMALDKQKYELARDLQDDFPQDLLSEEESIIGCPDFADGGGYFIQY